MHSQCVQAAGEEEERFPDSRWRWMEVGGPQNRHGQDEGDGAGGGWPENCQARASHWLLFQRRDETVLKRFGWPLALLALYQRTTYCTYL